MGSGDNTQTQATGDQAVQPENTASAFNLCDYVPFSFFCGDKPAQATQGQATDDVTVKWRGYWDSINRNEPGPEGPKMDFPGKAPDKPPAAADPDRIPIQTKPEMLENFDRLMRVMQGGDQSTNQHIDRPVSEKDFKTSFARELLSVGKMHNMDFDATRRLFMGIYAIETGGNGGHDIVPSNRSTSALGYKQLLMPTSMDLIYRYNDQITERLRSLAEAAPPGEREALIQKAEFMAKLKTTLQSEGDKFNPDRPTTDETAKRNFTEIANSRLPTSFHTDTELMKGRHFASAIHALNLDKDIGPIIQSMQMHDLLKDYDSLGVEKSMQTQIDQMRGEMSRFDSLKTQPDGEKQIKEAVKGLLDAAMKRKNTILTASLRDSLQPKLEAFAMGGPFGPFTQEERKALLGDKGILNMRSHEDPSTTQRALTPNEHALLLKVHNGISGGFTVDNMRSAALEVINLLGKDNAALMLDPKRADWPTPNSMTEEGYRNNELVRRRTSIELVLEIQRQRLGEKGSLTDRAGNRDFNMIFSKLIAQDK